MKKNLLIIVVSAAVVAIIAILVCLLIVPRKNVYKDKNVVDTGRDMFDFEENYKKKKVGVVYFSATGNTKTVAEKIAEIFETDTNEIIPAVAYTEEDLTDYQGNTRARRESEYDPVDPYEYTEDELAKMSEEEKKLLITDLPEINKMNVDAYNVIFLGYPIWFGKAPRVIYTFLRDTKLKNKTIIPFCTSGSSDISPSDNDIANFASEDINFMGGKRFEKDATIEEIKKWITLIGPDLDMLMSE